MVRRKPPNSGGVRHNRNARLSQAGHSLVTPPGFRNRERFPDRQQHMSGSENEQAKGVTRLLRGAPEKPFNRAGPRLPPYGASGAQRDKGSHPLPGGSPSDCPTSPG